MVISELIKDLMYEENLNQIELAKKTQLHSNTNFRMD